MGQSIVPFVLKPRREHLRLAHASFTQTRQDKTLCRKCKCTEQSRDGLSVCSSTSSFMCEWWQERMHVCSRKSAGRNKTSGWSGHMPCWAHCNAINFMGPIRGSLGTTQVPLGGFLRNSFCVHKEAEMGEKLPQPENRWKGRIVMIPSPSS